jgi:nitrogen fixation/metabolism regulation signal transduction histidine kinase
MTGFRGRLAVAWLLSLGAALVAILAGTGTMALIVTGLLVLASGVMLLAATARIGGFSRVAGGAAREIASGHLTARLDVPGGGDLGGLANEFNHMADAIEAQVKAAAQERSRLLAVINSSMDGTVAVDSHNNIQFASDAVFTLLERPPDDMVGQQFAWLVSNPEVIQGLRDCRTEGLRNSHVIERPGKRFLRAIITPIHGGGDWTSLVVFHDLTDVRRAVPG